MNTATISITETMEQVQQHVLRWQAMHPEVQDEANVLEASIAERWRNASVAEVLIQAEINSLIAKRDRDGSNPDKNPFVDTHAQADLFNNVPLTVPSRLKVNGKWRPYYEASMLDGLQWWLARMQAKRLEREQFEKAAREAESHEVQALAEVEKLRSLIAEMELSGINPADVPYART